jgi:hypothetical protein
VHVEGFGWFSPSNQPPEEAAVLITNPAVWAEDAPEPTAALPVDDPDPTKGDPEDSTGSAEAAVDPFDPGKHTVAEVLAYLNGLDDDQAAEAQRVLAAEQAGKARQSLLG